MITKQKQFEVWCGEFSRRWRKNWEFVCLVQDAWLNGYYKGRAEATKPVKDMAEALLEIGNKEQFVSINKLKRRCLAAGELKSEVEFKDGEQQLNGKSYTTTEKFKKDMLTHYGCTDIRVSVDSNGMYSFQGTFKVDNK